MSQAFVKENVLLSIIWLLATKTKFNFKVPASSVSQSGLQAENNKKEKIK
tara:strand:- start:2444 stop:2593 length:150 start_codon:yes stop_codon:yes gene_type:complete